ncbi:hypothetical protein [Microcoleus vaginatus]|uniref:hypothetical protein n=1 Tax=Microcoleus vaginatus TaxID=119532 RepID=UPI001F610E48
MSSLNAVNRQQSTVNSQQSTVNNSHSQFPMPHNRQSCLWKNLWKSSPPFVENFTRSPETVFAQKWAGDRPHQLFPKFSTSIYYLQVFPSKQLAFFSTVSTGRSTQK